MNIMRVGGFIAAVVLVLVGLLWTLQGLGMGNGGMSGHPVFILIGLVVIALGVFLGRTVDQRTKTSTPG